MNKISHITKEIKELNSAREYWLIRTEQGDYYDEFKTRGFISIGHNRMKNYRMTKCMSST